MRDVPRDVEASAAAAFKARQAGSACCGNQRPRTCGPGPRLACESWSSRCYQATDGCKSGSVRPWHDTQWMMLGWLDPRQHLSPDEVRSQPRAATSAAESLSSLGTASWVKIALTGHQVHMHRSGCTRVDGCTASDPLPPTRCRYTRRGTHQRRTCPCRQCPVA